MSVLFSHKVLEYLEYLVVILYERDYFGFLDSSERYVSELIDDIKKNLPIKQHKLSPKYFDKYGKGMKYAVFRKSKHTCWYVFFKTYTEKGETYYLVRYIANNHVIAKYL